MFATERQAKIRQTLLEQNRIDVATICELLLVSEATARRDLEKLETEGFLKRTHGGAVLAHKKTSYPLASSHPQALLEENKQIAHVASRLIEDGDSFFLSAGDISLHLVHEVAEKSNITIVTNCVNCLNALASFPQINIIGIGGFLEVYEDKMVLVGEISKKNIEDLYFEKAIICADGVDVAYGYSVKNMHHGELLDVVCQKSKEVIVLANHAKFGAKSFRKIGDITAYQKIVTDVQVAPFYKQFFFDNSIPIYTGFQE